MSKSGSRPDSIFARDLIVKAYIWKTIYIDLFQRGELDEEGERENFQRVEGSWQ